MTEVRPLDEIAAKLTELRGVRTRKGVAKALNIAYSSLCNYEHGRRIPPQRVQCRIADYYGVSVQDIFLRSNTMNHS